MPSGPKIPDDLRNWITQGAQEYPDRKPPEIHEEMLDWLKKFHPGFPVPGLDAVRKVVTNARRVKSQLDDPWSLGSCESFNIPQDATADLLAIWKRCIIGDVSFTVRQAIWAARLRRAVSATPTGSKLEELYHYAVSYAAHQRVAEALGKPFDTRFLDSNLAFRHEDGSFQWAQWWLATLLSVVPRSDDSMSALVEKVGAERALEFLIAPREMDSDEVQELRKMIRSSYPDLMADNTFYESWEDRSILLLRCLRTTSKWRAMSEEDRMDMSQRLIDPSKESTNSGFDLLEEFGVVAGFPTDSGKKGVSNE